MLCSRRCRGAVLDSWSQGCQAAVLELELPEAALSPPGRCTAQPPPEGWSALYPSPLQMGTVCMCDLGLSRSSPDITRRGALFPPVRALKALWPRLPSFAVFANGCRRPLRRSSVRGWSLRGAALCRLPAHRLAAAPLGLHPKGGPRSVWSAFCAHESVTLCARSHKGLRAARRLPREILEGASRASAWR